MKTTAIDDVLLAIVAALDAAVTYPVFDGPPSKQPNRPENKYVAIGAEELENQTQPTTSAKMQQQWVGLGQASRQETLDIHCVATGRSSTVKQARSLAFSAIQDVGVNLPKHPTPETYNALIASVDDVRSQNTSGGAVVMVQFTITVEARLI